MITDALLAALILLILSGCYAIVKPEYDRPDIKPTWIVTDKAMERCKAISGGWNWYACTHWPDGKPEPCIIIIPPDASNEVKEHERKHCRYGNWHQ